MQTLILVIHLILAIALVALVLMQQSEGGALGIGGGTPFMGARSTANMLTRTTGILATLFMLTSIGLTMMAARHSTPRSILDQIPAAPAKTAPASPAQTAPTLPPATPTPSAPVAP
jgi:preprotein translocase subunit SecG